METSRLIFDEGDRSISRSVLVELLRNARIATPGAIRDASSTSKTSDGINEFLNNPIDFEGNGTEIAAKPMGIW